MKDQSMRIIIIILHHLGISITRITTETEDTEISPRQVREWQDVIDINNHSETIISDHTQLSPASDQDVTHSPPPTIIMVTSLKNTFIMYFNILDYDLYNDPYYFNHRNYDYHEPYQRFPGDLE